MQTYTYVHTHTIILRIYDLSVGLPQVTEDKALYHTKCILTNSMLRNHPAPIPWGADSAAVESALQPCFREHPG